MNDPFLGLQDVPAFHVTSKTLLMGNLWIRNLCLAILGLRMDKTFHQSFIGPVHQAIRKAMRLPYTTLMHQLDPDSGIGQS